MPKRLDLARSFHLEPPKAPAAPVLRDIPPPKQRVAVQPGHKSITFYPTHEAWLQVHIAAKRAGRPVQDVMLDILDDWFQANGLQRCAREP